MLLSAIVLAASQMLPTTPPQVEMSSQDRWALIAGLRYRLDGPFVIANLAGAESTCAAAKVCVAADARFQRATNSEWAGLLSQTRIGGKPAAAIVALRGGRESSLKLSLVMSVFDPATRRWTNKVGEITMVTGNAPTVPGQRRLTGYATLASK